MYRKQKYIVPFPPMFIPTVHIVNDILYNSEKYLECT